MTSVPVDLPPLKSAVYMSTFPECDFFCNDVGRVSIVPSNCGSAESFMYAAFTQARRYRVA